MRPNPSRCIRGLGLAILVTLGIAGRAGAQLTLITPPSDVTFAPDSAEYLNTCCGVAAGPVSCVPASLDRKSVV